MSQQVDPHAKPYPVPYSTPASPAQLPVATGADGGRVYSSRKPWLRVGLIAAVVVALGAAAVGGAYAVAPDKVAGVFGGSTAQPAGSQSGQPDAGPGVGAVGVSRAAVPDSAATITVSAPDTLGNRPRIGTEDSDESADDSGVPGVTATAQGIYGNAATQDIVIVTAVASTSGTPQSRLSQFISGVSEELGVTSYVEADPGPLGGLARCGDGTLNGVPVSVCVWSDAGSTGALVRVLQSAQSFAPDFPALRAEVERTA
ncbi:hypothetical protein [Pseudonocardia alaniniphila]|uniref:Uncharacterized protein n=1 Tax=Pseudonocardia alaniniphila TaxID=75291 RepID=A0ABS9TNU8_9PSEU|nr:hypothetical protein [Pseudonocardia alaniniphila]MCH6170212.1 hypothetical protein [Pseudonocardia alaniniphila]